MKTKLFAVAYFMITGLVCFGQSEFLERQKEKAKNKVSQRVENKIDEGMDKTLDKTEESIEDGVKGNGGKKEKGKEKERENEKEDARENRDETNAQSVGTTSSESHKPLQINSKFDFVSGEKISWYEDFSNTAVGDFPIDWNTNASGEIVAIEGVQGHFLKLGQEGVYFPEGAGKLAENFTLELDMLVTEDFSPNGRGLRIFLTALTESPTMFNPDWNNQAKFAADIHPMGNNVGYCNYFVYDTQENLTIDNKQDIHVGNGKIIHVSIWRQKTRIRLYVDDQKIIDLPRALYPGVDYRLIFANYIWEGSLMIGNLRMAEGAPDTRSKLITDGKLVTRGILFDVNSDRLKTESYGALKDIATVLTENPDVHVLIVGHTDSDGDDGANLALSKRRAIAVKQELVQSFGIESGRITTDGKGESEPVDVNNTAVGKANNRRVEFIKQ